MIIVLLLLAQIANADTTTQPCDHARAVYKSIAAKSQKIVMAEKGDVCTITWTPKAGQAIAFVDKQSKRTAHADRAIVLLQKLRGGIATPIEKDELLDKLAALVLNQE